MSESNGRTTAPASFWWWALRIGVPVAVAALLLWLSPSFEYCFHAIPHYQPNQSYYERLAFILLFLGRYTGCMGVYADGNAGAIAALATVVIAVYTYTLWHVGSGQLAEVREQIGLAREDFSATHRPRLRIRHIRPTLVEGEPITVTCVVANVGEGEARVEPVPTIILRATSNRFGTSVGDVALFGADLWGGVSATLTTQGTPHPLIYQSAWGIDFADGEGNYLGRLEAIGEFVYADDRNIRRRTGFRRLYDPQTSTFRPAPAPDAEEEYED